MLGVFEALKGFLPKSGQTSPHIESWVSGLHYKLTALIFLACSLLVCCIQYVGNDSLISCIQAGNSDSWPIPGSVMNTYCYIMSTFTLPNNFKHIIHPGVGPRQNDDDPVEYKSYYQWVPFVLFFQACLFYTPHALFKLSEGGKVSTVLQCLYQRSALLQDTNRLSEQKVLANYFVKHLNTHNFWAFRMVFCELLFLVNVVSNIFLMDLFLGGEFSTYGLEVATFVGEVDPQNRIDPMSRVFPRMTKCTFHKFGFSGTIETHDALCMLPINVVNEKIYVFLWFWLLFLTLITSLFLVFRLTVVFNTPFLRNLIKRKLRHREGAADVLDDVTQKFQMGDWRLLHLLAHNMNPIVFGEFVAELDTQMVEKSMIDAEKRNSETDALLRQQIITKI